MILLPTLPANNTEKPVKSAGSAGPDGAFAAILAGEGEGETSESGKILPEGGKELPAEGELPTGLPLALQVIRKTLLRDRADAIEPAESAAEGDPNQQEVPADGEAVESAPKSPETLAPIALAIAVPATLEPAPAVETKADEATAARTPAEAFVRRDRIFPLVFPGKAPVIEGAPETGPASAAENAAGKQARRAPAQAASTLLAALAQRGEGTAAPAPARSTAQPVIALERAIAAAAEATPAVTQDARIARAPRMQPRREVTLELVKQAKTTAPAEHTVSPASTLAASPVYAAALPVASDTAAPTQNAPRTTDAATQAVRPHEFAALVDRLVEARESVRPANANLTVMHTDFGRVSLHFGQDNGNLTVALANSDPGFVPAVNAAVAADANNSETGFQGSRREDGGQAASARAGDSQAGERGAGRDSAERHREDRIKPQPHFASRDERRPRGGIFA